ncbi:MAG: cupin domain-containing protein [Parasporobacterium sp.]|nr:cupin domain-containing protein [Parasporobacterium sp.]
MAGYKVTKVGEPYVYTAPGHNECKCTRLHDMADVDNGRVIMGITHFLPKGGGTEIGGNPSDSIYYILEGEMTFEGEDGQQIVLQKGDSVHIAPNYKKKVTNTANIATQMLVVLVPPVQA